MPLTPKGKKIMRSMKKTYGKKKAEQVFYASKNKGKIKNVDKKKEKVMAGIFGVALRGLGMLGKRSARKKISPTIKSVKPNVPKTKTDKVKLAIAKQKTKASQARLDNTIFRIKQQSKRLKKKQEDKLKIKKRR